MDVVFNQGGSQKAQASRYFNESEALAQGISSKTMRWVKILFNSIRNL